VVVEFVEIKLGKMLSAVVVALKYAATVCPTTDSLAYGDDVPIPTLPVEVISILSVLSVFIVNPCVLTLPTKPEPDWDVPKIISISFKVSLPKKYAGPEFCIAIAGRSPMNGDASGVVPGPTTVS